MKRKNWMSIRPICVCLGVLVAFIGCVGPEAEFQSRCRRLAGIDDHPQAFVDDDRDAVMGLVREYVWAGQQNAVAATIAEGYRPKKRMPLWWGAVVDEFCSLWCDRDVPIDTGATPETIEALRLVAQHCRARNTSINAATAIRHIYPELARTVFRREYANFKLSHMAIGYMMGSWPNSVSPLNTERINFPEEIVSVLDAKRILTRKVRMDLDNERVVRAVNRYNQALRKLLEKGDDSKLEELGFWEAEKLFLQCWEEAATPDPEEPDDGEPGLFDGSDDDLPEAFFEED
jgi:hypothetical protein